MSLIIFLGIDWCISVCSSEQIERLQSEIRQYRKHTGSGEQSFIREIHVLEDRNRDLEKVIGNSEKRLIDERRNNDQLSGKLEQMERQNKELKREVGGCQAYFFFWDKHKHSVQLNNCYNTKSGARR